MQNQVLSIEQMQELIELGIDTSKASAFYYPNYGEYHEHPITKKYVHDIKSYNPHPSFVNGDRTLKDLNPDLFPAFTLQDILTLLEPYHRLMVIRHEPNGWIDSAFELLKFQYKDRNK